MPPVITRQTARILAERALHGSIDPDIVKWATELLVEGSDSLSLRKLAGLTEPLNPFEVSELRDRVLLDLGLADVGRDQAVLLLVRAILVDVQDADSHSMERAYSDIDHLYVRNGHMFELADLSRVHWAKLELDDGPHQWSWNGAGRHNIDRIMHEEASEFLREFDNTYHECRQQ